MKIVIHSWLYLLLLGFIRAPLYFIPFFCLGSMVDRRHLYLPTDSYLERCHRARWPYLMAWRACSRRTLPHINPASHQTYLPETSEETLTEDHPVIPSLCIFSTPTVIYTRHLEYSKLFGREDIKMCSRIVKGLGWVPYKTYYSEHPKIAKLIILLY